MSALRRCRVSVTDADGVTHVVEVLARASTTVAAAALAQFRHEAWVDTLGPTTVLKVRSTSRRRSTRADERLQRWANGPSVSPQQTLLKNRSGVRDPVRC